MRIRSIVLLLTIALPLLAADDPETLISKLRTTKDPEELERVVDRISTLGDKDGKSPMAVKKYLLEEATARLIEIAENKKLKWSLRGSAIHALRDMGAPRPVLTRIAEMALKDSDEYVKSRGEILQNFIDSMPAEEEPPGLDQLRLAAIEANAEEVKALIDDGVDVNAGAASDSPLNRVLSACAHQGGENDNILAVIDLLLAAGADVKELDDNRNTPLISAAQYCSDKAILKLIAAGADPNATNGTGINPLTMALIMSKLDAAEALVSKGARLTADQVTMVSSIATDERAKAIVKKASAPAKKK